MSDEQKCPFHSTAGGGTGNRHWWPNQLRLDLLNNSAPPDETRLTMAWVEVPSLRVLASEQVYSQVSPYRDERGSAIVLYSSDSGGFTAEITVDSDGVVLDYPGLARRTA